MTKPQFQLNDKTVALLGGMTLYGFSILSFLLIAILAPKVRFYDLVFSGESLLVQCIMGALFGSAAYLIIQFFLKREYFPDLFDNVLSFAKQMNWVQIVFISIAAGVGEELLFRVGIQHFLGIWPTAIFFVFIHGYYSLENPLVLVYGILMTILSAGFGYLYVNYGIAAPMMAHFLIDLFILAYLKLYKLKPKPVETQ